MYASGKESIFVKYTEWQIMKSNLEREANFVHLKFQTLKDLGLKEINHP